MKAIAQAERYGAVPVFASANGTTGAEAARKKIGWWLLFAAALGFVAAGIYTTARGFDARGQVRDQLAAQHIVTPSDASIPKAPVVNDKTAMAQANIIEKHMLETTGGKTYAQLERTDPNRAVAAQAESLRTALLSAVLAWNTANLVMGVGAFIATVGGLLLVSLFLFKPSKHTT